MKPSPGDFPTVEGGRKTSIRQLIYSTVVFASVCICVAHAFARVEAWLGGSGERSDQGGIAGTWSWEEVSFIQFVLLHLDSPSNDEITRG